MIRQCTDEDFETIYEIITDAAAAYKGVIPVDRWKEPYMSRDELCHEIKNGVRFWGSEEGGQLLGVMGIQDVKDVTLIRHAYVRTAHRNKGIGSAWAGGEPFASSAATSSNKMQGVASLYSDCRIIGYLNVASGLIVASDGGNSLHFTPGPGNYPVYGYFEGDKLMGISIDFGLKA